MKEIYKVYYYNKLNNINFSITKIIIIKLKFSRTTFLTIHNIDYIIL